MTGETPEPETNPDTETGAEPETKRRRPYFRSSQTPRLTGDAAVRQGEITTLAFKLLGGRDGAIAFLNGFHAELDGRPLDIATASPEGFTRVETALTEAARAG